MGPASSHLEQRKKKSGGREAKEEGMRAIRGLFLHGEEDGEIQPQNRKMDRKQKPSPLDFPSQQHSGHLARGCTLSLHLSHPRHASSVFP